MAQKVYKRIGLRRDRNLSDLSNSTEALNNMLGDLAAVGGAGDTFIAEDLDAIKNSYAQGLTHNDYIQVGGSAVRYWDNATQDQRIFEPRITYQNKLDQFDIFSGNPRLAGGDGLTASYYQNDQVLENTEDIFTGEPFNVDNFWEAGNFEWDRKLHPSAINVNGGIQWEGYFVPTDTGLHTFTLNTSGCFTLDFQTEGYQEDDGGNIISVGIETYTEYKRIGIGSTTQGDAANWGSGNNQISIDDADFMKHVAIGQSVTSFGNIADGVNIDDISGTTITLTDPESGDAVLSNFSNQDITFSKGVGTSVNGSYTTDYSLEKYKKYRIRFRYFVPQIFDTSGFIRNFNVDYDPPVGGSNDLRFNKLFSLNYDFTNASKVKTPFILNDLDKEILNDKSDFRVYESFRGFVNGRTSFFHNSISGYHAAKPKRMQDIYDFYLLKNNLRVLVMLNVKYIIDLNETYNGYQHVELHLGLENNVALQNFNIKVNSELLVFYSNQGYGGRAEDAGMTISVTSSNQEISGNPTK